GTENAMTSSSARNRAGWPAGTFGPGGNGRGSYRQPGSGQRLSSPGSRAGSIICIALQGTIKKRDNLFDYRFGCLFWQQVTADYVKSAHVVSPTAPDVGRCQRAGFHPAGNKPFISPEHHYRTSNLTSRCPISRIMISIDVI